MTHDQAHTPDHGDDPRGWWRRLVPGVIAFILGGLFYAIGLGFRGVGVEGMALVEHAQKLAQSLGSGLDASSLASTRPLSQLGLAWLWAVVPHSTLRIGGVLSALFVAGALPAVWSMGRSLSGPTAGLAAATLMAGLPIVAGSATALGQGALMLFLWCWFLRLGTLDRYPWWVGLSLGIVGGLALLVWPPIVVWIPFGLYLHLTARHIDRPTVDRDERATEGCIDRPVVPLAVLLAPLVAAIVATACHPGLRAHLVEGWRTFARFNLSWAPESFLYASHAYTESRPPPWSGFVLLWRGLPLVAGLLGVIGWIRHLDLSGEPIDVADGGQLVARTMVWGLPLACLLPWLTRSRTFGGVHFLLAAAPAIAVLGGDVASRLIEHIETRLDGYLSTRTTIGVASVIGVLLVASPLFETVRVHPFEGSYYNPGAGGLASALEEGYPASRDGVVPISAASTVVEHTPKGRLFVDADRDIFGLYLRQKLLPSFDNLPSGYRAGAILRRFDRASGHLWASNGPREPEPLLFVNGGASRLETWRVDGVALWWLERYSTSPSRSDSTSSSE